jgi:hypothetical protein
MPGFQSVPETGLRKKLGDQIRLPKSIGEAEARQSLPTPVELAGEIDAAHEPMPRQQP